MDEKIVLITGKNHEINVSLAEKLISQNIKVAYFIDEKDSFRDPRLSDSNKSRVFRCDFNKEEELEKARDKINETFGKVDRIIFSQKERIQKPFLQIEEDEWDYVYQTTLQDYFFLVKIFTETMVAQGIHGKILCISNTSCVVPRKKISCYSSAFAAQALLDSSLSIELAKRNITLNTICINSEEQFEEYDKNDITHNDSLQPFVTMETLEKIVLSLFSDIWNELTGKKILVDSGEILGDIG
jgi:NAD(P)-dependent dehydrogenase (short-subunit alcohol dehydrogenase family)